MTDSGDKRTVLVADDDPRLRNLLTWTLEQGQFNVVEAADGLSALETGRRIKPDLYLLDVGMPGMNGIEVCRQLRAEQVISPILILTGLRVTRALSWNNVALRSCRSRRPRFAGWFQTLTVMRRSPSSMAGL